MKSGEIVLCWILLVACSGRTRESQVTTSYPTPFIADEVATLSSTLVSALPTKVELDTRKVALGRQLFDDRRMSGDGRVACSHCHQLKNGGANGLVRASLPGREPTSVNVPSIFNVAYLYRFAWSGRFRDVGQQIDFAMGSPTAMASSWELALNNVRSDTTLRAAFSQVYSEGLTTSTLRDSIVTYSLSLSTPNSRFDRFLRRELTLSHDEQEGYTLFVDYGCVSCHQGINLGGNMVQRFGIMRDYFTDKAVLSEADLGLYRETKREEDRYVFRVPSLRNVALTAPYFHDGTAETLADAVRTMGRYQLGRELQVREVESMVAFLRSLTGELDGWPL